MGGNSTNKEALSAPSTQSTLEPLDPFLQKSSLDTLTESIIRKIMRLACAVGSVGILSAVVSPQPFHPLALSISIAATVVIFGLTYLPIRVRLLSVAYPWTLSLLGVFLTSLMGPRPDALLLATGGLFIGSLVLKKWNLIFLMFGTACAALASALLGSDTMTPERTEAWTSSLSALFAVIVPAAFAGRMLVAALARTLEERETLVEKVLQERGVLQDTVESLENTRTQLTHAQKLELVSQMAGGIAHDMNNALTAVIGEASLLEDDVAEERERIIEAAAYAGKLTQQLMVFGRRDTAQPRALNLGETLRGFAESVRRVMPSDITVSFVGAKETLVIIADPLQLWQVVLNLSGNAKDAMVGGGDLTLSLSADEKHREAVLLVEDTGTGIPPETQEKVFEPFFTTKPSGRGTGLGLASVKQLVETMGGTIQLRSTEGKGTSFEIRLPLSDAELTQEEVKSGITESKTGTILVVDDDVRVRSVVYSILKRDGHQVLEAGSVSAAADIAKNHRGTIDVLLTDVVMPEGGGAMAIERVRAVIPDIKILVMSGYAADEALRRGIERGDYPFLAKPFSALDLRETIANLVRS